MKKFIFFILVLGCFTYAHSKGTHQYITKEAYKLLKLNLGYDIPILRDHLDTDLAANEGGPYQLPYITRGAWREDVEDPVYNYFLGNPPEIYGDYFGHITLEGELLNSILGSFNPLDDPWISITHFWDPDNGDLQDSHIHARSLTDDFYVIVPNAFQKLLKYVNGNYDFYVNAVVWGLPIHSDGSGYCATQRAIVHFSYNSLFDLYKNKNLYVTKVTWLTGQEVEYNQPYKFKKLNWVALNESYSLFLDSIVFETLGRMCHLLQDMSVPEHVHLDEHGPFSENSDYENFTESDRFWNYLMVNNLVGSYINPYISASPLHFLMYTTAQISDHFGSNGPYSGDGDNNFGGMATTEELSYLNSLNLSSYGEPTGMKTDMSINDLINIRDKLIPQAIRATAGLLYWFATEAEILSIPTQPLSISISGPTTIDWGPSGESTWNASVSGGNQPYHYKWWYKYSGGSEALSTKTKNKKFALDDSVHTNLLPIGGGYWSAMYIDSPNLTRYDYKDHYLKCVVTDADNTEVTSNIMYIRIRGGSALQSSILTDGELDKSHRSEVVSESQITEDRLFYNYPNPFNPSTVIYFTLKSAGNVNLKVYNILGQTVEVLLSELKASGRYKKRFNGKNLPSGIYIYKLTTDGYSATGKMNLMK